MDYVKRAKEVIYGTKETNLLSSDTKKTNLPIACEGSALTRTYEINESDELNASVRIYSKVLDAVLWIAPDPVAAAELHPEGPVLLPNEAMILGRMAEADAREIFATVARVQRAVPGARLREVRRR